MTKDRIGAYLGKMVIVKLYDNDVIKGVLKTGDQINKEKGYMRFNPKYYHLTDNNLIYISRAFLGHHIKHIEEIKQ